MKKMMFQDILYLDMDRTRLSIKITYFSLFFKFLSDIIGLNKQHRSQGFHSILWNYYIDTPYTYMLCLALSDQGASQKSEEKLVK